MDDDLLVGYVSERFRNKDDVEVALLRPEYRFDKRSRGWQPIQEVTQEFPNRGCVTWVKAPPEAQNGTVWLFEYSEHENFDSSNPRLDRYRIDFDKPPVELMEVIHVAVSDEDGLRRALLRGLVIRFIPSRQVYMTIDDQSWIGPLRLVPKGNDIWVLDQSLQANPVPRVTSAPPGDLSVLNLNGARRRFLHPKTPPLASIGQIDLADDHLNLKRVLEWCRKRPDLAKALNLTKKAIDDAMSVLPEDDTDLWMQRVRRARRYVERLEETAADVSAFEEALFALPRVRERFAEVEREGRAAAQAREEERLIAEARQELERVQEDLRQKQDDLRQKIDQLSQLQREVEEWERTLANRKQQLSNQLDLADEALRKRIAILFQRPVEALTQIALLRAALGMNDVQANQRIVPVGAARLMPPETALRRGEAHIADEAQLLTAVRRSMTVIGEEASLAVKMHSAFACGLMPLLTGPGALAALEAYAQAVNGGRVVWVPVTPTMLKPADLFGDVHPVTGRFMPHPAGLLDLLLFAAQPEQRDKLFLVVLDGVNRAAVDAYLLPVLACYSATQNDHIRRVLPVAHPGLIDPSNPYAEAARLVWPENALLAGTLVHGAATAPLPPDLWAYACVIETGRGRIAQRNRVFSQSSEVTPSTWAKWREEIDTEAFQEATAALNELKREDAETDFRAPAVILEACAHLEASMAARSGPKSREFAVRGVLAPYALATGQSEAFVQAMETLGVKNDTDVHNLLKAILA